jgi:uncharacterized membrane protein
VRNRLLMIDAGAAVVLAALVLIFTPGVAVAGMIALVVVLVCAVSFVLEARRARSRAVARRGRSQSARRPPRR